MKEQIYHFDKHLYKCFTVLKNRHKEFNGKQVRSIQIDSLKKKMVMNFEKDKSKELEGDIKDVLNQFIIDRKKIYKNQEVNYIRFDLLTDSIFVGFSGFKD